MYGERYSRPKLEAAVETKIAAMNDSQVKEALRELASWAVGNLTCPHELCSLDEASWEEIFGERCLKMIGVEVATAKE
jgi:hypothetical protein